MSEMLLIVLYAALAVAGAGLVLGLFVGLLSVLFAVPEDEKTGRIRDCLPGANCGGCGYAGCSDFAKALAAEEDTPDKCRVCDEEQSRKISEILGIKMSVQEKKVAVVFCNGSFSRRLELGHYNGVLDCRSAASIYGNGMGCQYGCMGLGSCARECSYGAIEMRGGLAVVHPELCRACGKCIDVCPRHLIRLVPASAKIHVYCNSLAEPKERLKNCKGACLSCGKCARQAPGSIQIQNHLVRVNYRRPPEESFAQTAGCPTGALQTEKIHCTLSPNCSGGKCAVKGGCDHGA